MPLRECTDGGKPGFQWGEEGKCFVYDPDSEDSRGHARRRAIGQGIAMGDIKVEKAALDYGEFDVAWALKYRHEVLHGLWRRAADDDSREAIAVMHVDVVNELLTIGSEHPEPPDDGLDATMEPEDDDPTEVPKYASAVIRKADEEKRLVYGVVLEPFIVDAQKEWERPEMIEQTAHDFLTSYNAGTELRIQHNKGPFAHLAGGVELVESYIAPQDLDFDGELAPPDVVRKGSWVIVVHVTDDTIWQGVKDGTITGFSVGGIATVRA